MTERLARAVKIKRAGTNLRDCSEQISARYGTVSPSTLSRVENAKGGTDLETLIVLCDWLGQSVADYVIGERVTMTVPTRDDTISRVSAALLADPTIDEAAQQAFVTLLGRVLGL